MQNIRDDDPRIKKMWHYCKKRYSPEPSCKSCRRCFSFLLIVSCVDRSVLQSSSAPRKDAAVPGTEQSQEMKHSDDGGSEPQQAKRLAVGNGPGVGQTEVQNVVSWVFSPMTSNVLMTVQVRHLP